MPPATVGFSDAKDFPSLEFTDPQPNNNVAVHFGRQEEARELLLREPDVSAFGAEKPAKSGARKPVARKVGAR